MHSCKAVWEVMGFSLPLAGVAYSLAKKAIYTCKHIYMYIYKYAHIFTFLSLYIKNKLRYVYMHVYVG